MNPLFAMLMGMGGGQMTGQSPQPFMGQGPTTKPVPDPLNIAQLLGMSASAKKPQSQQGGFNPMQGFNQSQVGVGVTPPAPMLPGPDGMQMDTGMVLPQKQYMGGGAGDLVPGIQAMQTQSQQPQALGGRPSFGGLDWGSLLAPGTRDAPNALVRMGEGYNSGGLIGALGYLLTDMSKTSQPQ